MLALLLTQFALAKKVEIPIDIGVGPAANLITGPVYRDQPVHTGLVISIAAVLDKKRLRQLKHEIPSQYRSQVLQMDEIRISHFLIPDQFFISGRGWFGGSTGMYGVGFRPLSIRIPLLKGPFRFDVGAGLRATYAYLPSDTLGNTHFLRPGIDVKANVEVPLSETLLVSFGWNSQAYIPQEVGGSILSLGDLDSSMWHIGQGYFKVHVRVPYTYKTSGGGGGGKKKGKKGKKKS